MEEPLALAEAQEKYLASHQARNSSALTLKHYRSTFRDFERYLAEAKQPRDLRSLSTDCVRGFGKWLKETPTRGWRGTTIRSPQGIHARLRDIRSFARWLEAEELINRAPRVELPKLPQEEFPVLSDAEVTALFSCEHLAARGDQAVRNRALIALMIDTGLRRSEVASVELADVDLADQLILVRGKGNKQRRVPFSTGVLDLLKKWLAIRGDEPGTLFWLTSTGIYSLFQRIQKETGLAIHPHLLRHQAASMMVRNNADIYSVKRVLGHASVTTTERYVTQNYADLKAKHAAASPFESLREALPVVDTKPRKKRLAL